MAQPTATKRKKTAQKINLSQSQQAKKAERDHELRQEFSTKVQELQEQQKQEMQDCISNEKFPAEQVRPEFQHWVEKALPHETTVLMGTSYPDFKKQWRAMCTKPVTDYSMQEMGLAINCVESKSMVQLQCANADAYVELQDGVAVMALSWNVHMEELKKPITEKYKDLSTALRNEYNDKKAK